MTQLGLSKARLYRIATLNQPENLIYHFIEEMLDEGQLQQTRLVGLPSHKKPNFRLKANIMESGVSRI